MVNPNNIKYYPITLKLCKSITEILTLKAFSPLAGSLLWGHHVVSKPRLSQAQRPVGKSWNYMKWERDAWPASRCSIPCCNSSHHLTATAWQTLSHTCPAKPFLNPWPIKNHWGLLSLQSWWPDAEQRWIYQAGSTNQHGFLTTWEHACFSFSQTLCLNHFHSKMVNEGI